MSLGRRINRMEINEKEYNRVKVFPNGSKIEIKRVKKEDKLRGNQWR